MKKILFLVAGSLCILAVGGYLLFFSKTPPEYRTVAVERGSVVAAVSATGTLNAVTTVQVGTQVSGTILSLLADFNSPVRKGEPIARIDPALFNAQVEQTRGSWLNAVAAEEKARVAVNDAQRTLKRNLTLLKDGIVSQSDYDAAEAAYESARASLRAASASVIQSRGAYRQAETNLAYSIIRSPVDGIVISRNVDVGQTVAASFQTPTLFTIAQDLTKMQIDTNVDEADISRVKTGQTARFTVDAYPETAFTGKVGQIRNAPVVTQNVVTYIVIIEVDNRDLKLKPGMTANVEIETARRDDVLLIPGAALRFRPRQGDAAAQKGRGSSQGKGQMVYLLPDDGKPLPVPVKTGLADSSRVELLSGGVKQGDRVIVEQVSPKNGRNGMGPPMGPRF